MQAELLLHLLRMLYKITSLKISCTALLAPLVFFLSCKYDNTKIVDRAFTDSLITHFTLGATVTATADEMLFWKKRIDPKSVGLVNESRYASLLISRFHQFGDIQDIREADSIMRAVNAAYNGKEASPNISLCAYSILQHRFTAADNYLAAARRDGLKKYEALTVSFDVDFELGQYVNAGSYIQQLKPFADYGYYFRRSKLDHFHGEMDSAIKSMLTAATKAESSVYLQNVALANAADLYIHAGKLQDANNLYKQCIRTNSTDFHSITGMGWIALVHDRNDSLAQQLFEFVHTKNKLPDPLFKLYQVAQQRGDSTATARYAGMFAEQATDTVYGNMYNKYLIELYTGILHDPVKSGLLLQSASWVTVIRRRPMRGTHGACLLITKKRRLIKYMNKAYQVNHWKVLNYTGWEN